MRLIDDTPEPDSWVESKPMNPPLRVLDDHRSLNPDNLYTFEGVDGSGKTTILREVKRVCEERKKTIKLMRVGGSEVIYHAMQRAKWLNVDPVSINLLNWVSLYDQTIRIKEKYNTPTLIFFDRYTLTVKVRGAVEGQDLEYMDILERGVPKPKAVFLLDCDPEICLDRIKESGRGITYIETGVRDADFNPAEMENIDDPATRERCYIEHVERLRQQYRILAERESNVHIIDNSNSVKQSVEAILDRMDL